MPSCHFCRAPGGAALQHPLGLTGDTQYCCERCESRVIDAWDRLVRDVRREVIAEDAPRHLESVRSILDRLQKSGFREW